MLRLTFFVEMGIFLDTLKMAVERFGSYILEERIGLGGMAEVYRAKRFGPGNFEKVLAIKRIRSELQAHSEWLPMFMEEARIAATLSHSNIIDVYDFGQIDGSYFIAMEYIHGVDLLQVLNRQVEMKTRMPLDLALHIIGETLSAIQYAHERRNTDGSRSPVVHRDVSPSNVLLSYEGQIKLTDFGIAKAIMAKGPTTQPGIFKGKLSYVAPEQLMGGKIDERTDLFSVGILLYTVLTNQRPFQAREKDKQIDLLRSGKYVPMRSIDSRLPVRLEQIVERSLRPDRNERYQSAADFLHVIREALPGDHRGQYPQRVASHLRLLFGEQAVGVVGRLDLQSHTIPESDIADPSITFTPPDPVRWKKAPLIFGTLIFGGLLLVWRFLQEEQRAISSIPLPVKPTASPLPLKTIRPSPIPTRVDRVPPPPVTFTPSEEPSPLPTAPPPRPVVKKETKSAPIRNYGSMTVFPDGPFAKVWVDGQPIGNTPILNYRMEVGRHKIRFENEKLDRTREINITISKGQTLNLTDIWGSEEEE